MSEFVYSISEIFSKALSDNNCTEYYIPPYQRGYKWAALSPNDQVPQMLTDTYNAFKIKAEEYFLQYITIKRIDYNGKKCLEIIDGQQRLTTLSILYYILGEGQNISKDKLIYFRYEKSKSNAFDVLNMNPEYVKAHQDLTYMLRAAQCIQTFIGLLEDENELDQYIWYLNNRVKIIFNLEDEYTASEEIFENLNGNKVPLSNQHLIKGLLLTNAVIRKTSYNRQLTYKEILNQRTIMGRIWDEIYAWITRDDVSRFFFAVKRHSNPDGMESLLKMVITHYEETSDVLLDEAEKPLSVIDRFISSFCNNQQSAPLSTSSYSLFNRFNKLIRSEKQAIAILNELKHAYRVLYNLWNNEAEMFNLFGYVRFSTFDTSWVYNLIWGDANALKMRLAEKSLELIPDMDNENVKKDDYACLRYSSSNPKLTCLLLSFSVFLSKTNKFDFFRYDKLNWTFEHISPQNPKKEIAIPSNLRMYVTTRIADDNNIKPERKKELKDIIDRGGKVPTEDLGFLFDSDIDENHVGNMALLGDGENSSLSNNPFIIKRNIIISKHNEGSFVPTHTICVYEKSLDNERLTNAFSPDFLCWSQSDIDAHTEWMKKYNSEIRSYLNSFIIGKQ